MKVLLYLADMVRGDLFNPCTGTTLIEKYFKSKGGTYWPNTFTPNPDTPRSTACLFTGNNVVENGIGLRSLSLADSFRHDQVSIFRSLAENGVKNAIWRESIEIDQGIWLPGDCLNQVGQFSSKIEISEWLRGEENVLVYRHDNIYHRVMDQLPIIRSPHQVGLDLVFQNLLEAVEMLDWDIIWFFSDHGCILPNESRNPVDMLNKNRTNIPLYLWTRKDKDLTINVGLRSIVDLYPTIHYQFGINLTNKISGKNLLLDEGHKSIWMDDYANFLPLDNELPNVYGERTLDKLTIYFENKLWCKVEGSSNWKSAESERIEIIEKMKNSFPFFYLVHLAAKRRQTIDRSYKNLTNTKSTFNLKRLVPKKVIPVNFQKFMYKMILSASFQKSAYKFRKATK